MSAWQEYKKRIGNTRPWDIVTQPKVDQDLSEKRLSTCLECPELIQATKQCKQCGCFMSMKVRLEKAACPLGKW